MLLYLESDYGSDDDFQSPYSPIVPLKDIAIPSGFLLPDFREENSTQRECDIFSFGNRTIKGRWMDTARTVIREMKSLDSDRFACVSCM